MEGGWALRGMGFFASLCALSGCASAALEPGGEQEKVVVVAPEEQGLVTFDELTAARLEGSYEYRGETLRFESEARDGVYYVTVTLRGMVLSATLDTTGAFDLDGYNDADGTDTAMTAVDRALIHALESALTDLYRARAAELPALDVFSRTLGLWSDYPDTVALRRMFYARHERKGSGSSLCDNLNKPGQGSGFVPRYTWASHDCLKLKGVFTTDCGPLTAGCAYGNDSSTLDSVFMSMHPGGSCGDGRFFGTSAANMRCYEPDHDSNVEFAYGDCFGRCGLGCGGSTQFTQACLDHDACVSSGHWTANPLSACDDEFAEAAVDYLVLSNCGGALQIDYNWAGSSYEGACPASWKNANDGCDAACQFVDGDCFR
jgi:hypothetical protein